MRLRIRLTSTQGDAPPPTRSMRESDAAAAPGMSFPDNETLYGGNWDSRVMISLMAAMQRSIGSDVDFVALFPGSLATMTELKRFSCTRCELAAVPTSLFELRSLSECELRENAIDKVPVQFEGSAISKLDLTGNRLRDFPSEVWLMPQLETLELTHNLISECTAPQSQPDVLNSIEKSALRSLTLGSNPIRTFDCQFPSLETLSLQNTSLRTVPPALPALTKLQRLDLSMNPTLSLDTGAIPVLATVTELNLSHNGLKTLPKELHALVPRISTLVLTGNEIREHSDLLGAESLRTLTTLILDQNNISNATAVLERFPALEHLSMAFSNVRDCTGSQLIGRMRTLNMSGNAINSWNLSAPKLEVLDLSWNNFTSIPETVFKLQNLIQLNLTGNPIEPWIPTTSEASFLSKLEIFSIEQSAFASCAVEEQQDLHGFRVCVSANESPAPSSNVPLTTSEKSGGGKTSASNQILYLGGSFLIAILIAVWVYLMGRRRSQAPKSDFASSSASQRQGSSSIPSPGGSSRSNPFSEVTSARRPSNPRRSEFLADRIGSRSSSSEVSYVSGGSGRSLAPLPAPPMMRHLHCEVTGERTYWEDDELQAWRVDFDQITTQKRIAVGIFVEIWRASYRTDAVAVKKLKPSMRLLYHRHSATVDASVLDDFIFEIRVLARLNHPRIVAFYGAAWTSDSDIMAVMEFMPQQDLRAFLTRQRRKSQRSSRDSVNETWAIELVHMALCVAEALTCLHALEPAIIHGNVQAKNVLLDGHMDSKLCDFGSAQYCSVRASLFDSHSTKASDESLSSANGMIVMPNYRADASAWLAPEVLRSRAMCDPSIDMYAFGVLLSEIDTRELPYADARGDTGDGEAVPPTDASIRHQVALGTLRPSFLPTCPPSILSLATQCLAHDPQDRPTSAEVACTLRGILAEMERASLVSMTSGGALGPNPTQLAAMPSTESSVSDSDMSQRTIELKHYVSATPLEMK